MGSGVLHCLIFFLGLVFCLGTQVRASDYGRNAGLSCSPEDVVKFLKQNQDHKGRRLAELYKFEQGKLGGEEPLIGSTNRELAGNNFGSIKSMRELDVVTPTTTVPVINPTNPDSIPIINPNTPPPPTYTTPVTSAPPPPIYIAPVTSAPPPPTYTTPVISSAPPPPTYTTPITTPTTPSPVTSGQTWCAAISSASQTALQVALDYACGFGGADCSAIQQGGSCFNPDTVRDHASYAFNNYYQKNPVPTSCDFGGTAKVTNTDPSSGACIYPSTGTSSTVLNTTNPTGSGSTVFGPEPPSYSGAITSTSPGLLIFFPLTGLLLPLIVRDHP